MASYAEKSYDPSFFGIHTFKILPQFAFSAKLQQRLIVIEKKLLYYPRTIL